MEKKNNFVSLIRRGVVLAEDLAASVRISAFHEELAMPLPKAEPQVLYLFS